MFLSPVRNQQPAKVSLLLYPGPGVCVCGAEAERESVPGMRRPLVSVTGVTLVCEDVTWLKP